MGRQSESRCLPTCQCSLSVLLIHSAIYVPAPQLAVNRPCVSSTTIAATLPAVAPRLQAVALIISSHAMLEILLAGAVGMVDETGLKGEVGIDDEVQGRSTSAGRCTFQSPVGGKIML